MKTKIKAALRGEKKNHTFGEGKGQRKQLLRVQNRLTNPEEGGLWSGL